MAVKRPSLLIAALVLLAGSLVMLWFVILGGVTRVPPLSQTYFLRADTAGITGARPISQWDYLYVCGDGNTDCSPAWPDPPFGWAWSANPANAPPELVGGHGGGTTSYHFYYMWRMGWVFYLLALFFMHVTFLCGLVAFFGRLGAAITLLWGVVAFVFLTVGVALMTATFVEARDAFIRSGRWAELGKYAFGFSWASWFALLLASILFYLAIGRRERDPVGSPKFPGGRKWGRRKSTRSRMSNDVGGKRVKDEYA